MSDEDKILILLSVLFILAMTFLFLQPGEDGTRQTINEENGDVQHVQLVQAITILENPELVCQELCLKRQGHFRKIETNNDNLIYCTCQSGYKTIIGQASPP